MARIRADRATLRSPVVVARWLGAVVILTLVAAACATPAAAPTPRPLAVITITAPKAGATVPAGDVTVTFEVSDVTLVPAASAQKPEDYHVHATLDLDSSPWIGTTVAVPASPNPNPSRLIHTAAKTVTFPAVTAGEHTVTVWLSLSSHVSVKPSVSTSVKFTVR
jgi:hypothetical protein